MIMWNDCVLIFSDITYYREHGCKGNKKRKYGHRKVQLYHSVNTFIMSTSPAALRRRFSYVLPHYEQPSIKIDVHSCRGDVRKDVSPFLSFCGTGKSLKHSMMIEQKTRGNRKRDIQIVSAAEIGQKEPNDPRFAFMVPMICKPLQAGTSHRPVICEGCACRAENPDENHALVFAYPMQLPTAGSMQFVKDLA